jgi:hypothetical protein
MGTRLKTRLRVLEMQAAEPDVLAGTGLASLLAYVAQHPEEGTLEWPATWETDPPPRGLAGCLWKIRHGQANLL